MSQDTLVFIIVTQASIHGELQGNYPGAHGTPQRSQQTLTCRLCTISVSFEVSASSFLQLPEDSVQFSQQLSTFPTCTESAAILVFAFESNPAEGERREGGATPKTSPALSFPLRRNTYTYTRANKRKK